MTFKKFPKLVADPTTNEQKICEWRGRMQKQLREIFARVNEETHPIGTKSWLHEWRSLEKELLRALGDE